MGKLKISELKNEILSGITVSLAMVPEAVAFAFVAGLSPIVGLHTSVIIALCAAIFGGRPGMISGAAGSIAVVFVSLVSLYGVEYLFPTVILMGIFQILIGVFKWGKFSRLIPHPVMLGFVNGLAIVIFIAQLNQFKIINEFGNKVWMSGIQLYVMIFLVLITMGITHFLPKFTKAIPSSLIAIGVTTVLAIIATNNGIHMPNVKDFAGGSLDGGFPKFHLPNIPFKLETLKIILPFSIVATLVGLIESLLTLSLIDELTDTRGQANKECIGQGIGNLINGFFGGTGGCAMIGQSMINITSGGRGRISGIAMGISLLLFILLGSKVIEIIPLAALVGVMFIVVMETFAWETLKFRKRVPKKDILIILIVTLITIFEDLAMAVVVGVILSALNFAWEKGKKINGIIEETPEEKVYILEGPLFFGSVTSFKDLFHPKDDPENIIIDFKNSKIMDHSAIEAVNSITEKYKRNGKNLKLKHLSEDCKTLLINAQELIKVNIIEDPIYFVGDDLLD